VEPRAGKWREAMEVSDHISRYPRIRARQRKFSFSWPGASKGRSIVMSGRRGSFNGVAPNSTSMDTCRVCLGPALAMAPLWYVISTD